jgi:hypothetical protein
MDTHLVCVYAMQKEAIFVVTIVVIAVPLSGLHLALHLHWCAVVLGVYERGRHAI